MTKGIFITATGTDVGKTYVSALILKNLKKSGLNCGYYKPAMSGIEEGKLSDVEYVFKVAGLDGNPMDFVSYPFTEALSPHLASERANIEIKIDKIKSDFQKVCEKYDYVLVEGAGGIICPFNMRKGQELLLPDVIKVLGLDIIIVADAKLGTINSTVLTVEYAKQHNINISGIILNNYDENDFMQVDNKEKIEKLTGIKIITTVRKNDKEIKCLPCQKEGNRKAVEGFLINIFKEI
ncbi:dethiobiotin synthase [bacterium]|nr:dethiobiotin synthase [bacterium]